MTPTADAGTATTTAPPVLLLATDGSADATLARTAAVQLAGRCGFDLHIVHAWQIPIVAGGFPGYAAPQEFFDGCADAARTILDEERGRAEADGARVAEAHLVEGRPASAVVELAERLDAALVVMGSRGLGGLGRLVVGSVSEETLHSAHRPVLILRGGAEAWPPTQIVTGDDRSPNALAAAMEAGRMAQALGVPLLVLHVLPQVEEGVDPHGASRGLIEALTAELEARCTAVRERSGADVRSRVAGGDPAQVILDTARSGGQAGLIATGCRGAGLMTRMRFGSVSNRLLHGSRVPMLIVPAPAATATDGGVS